MFWPVLEVGSPCGDFVFVDAFRCLVWALWRSFLNGLLIAVGVGGW